MKKLFVNAGCAAALALALIQLPACKSKAKEEVKDSVAVTDTPKTETTPVVISPDEQLSKDVKDATKDFPGVTAKVDSGAVTLTGSITREKLQKLMMSLNSVHPKKINNQLTITK